MTLRFNPPPAVAKKLPRYASYAGGVMKTHHRIGDAKNSLNNRMWTTVGQYPDRERVTTYAAILENIKGQWYSLYEVPEGSTYKTLPWVKAQFRPGYYSTWMNVDEYKDNPYYGPKLTNGELTVQYNNVPMTVDEYVAWRIQVEREIWESELEKANNG